MAKAAQIIIISGNSIGLENDALVLKSALEKSYPNIRLSILLGKDGAGKKIKAVIRLFYKKLTKQNLVLIHMEEVQSALTWLAKKNYLIPNQEWFRSHTEKTVINDEKIELLCKTQDAMRAFSDFSHRSRFLGFTSISRYQEKSQKDFTQFLHLAGKSEQKGTLEVIRAWKKNPQWPSLTLKSSVDSHIIAAQNVPNIKLIVDDLSQEALLELMNSHGVHICASQMEGFGHYIVEALSTGAIVVTTNAAPMNEIVTKTHGYLVPACQSYQQYRANAYQIDESEFEKIIIEILNLSLSQLLAMSNQAKQRYFELSLAFEKRVQSYFSPYC